MHIPKEELQKFVEKKGFNFATNYENQDIALVVLSSLITPYEEELSYELYDKKIPDCSLAEFESFFAKTLKPNSLLMSLKLSKNQERLIAFLKSKAIDDELFLKLIKLYDWGGAGIFESDENRDIALAFINRFFTRRLHFNHNDIAHSPATLLDIALTSSNVAALKALFTMPNHTINIKELDGMKPKSIKEALALNSALDEELRKLLLNLRDERVDNFLSLNPTLTPMQQELLFQRGSKQTKINLSKNQNLDKELFKKLLQEDEEIVQTLLFSQEITLDIFELLDSKYYPILAQSSTIAAIKDRLLGYSKEIDLILASNALLKKEELEKLYKQYQDEAILALSKNPHTPKELLEKFYNLKDKTIILHLASNPNTPEYIIDELYNKNSYEINKALAKNPALKDEYIEFFKLDNELITIMSQVPTLRKKIAKKREYL